MQYENIKFFTQKSVTHKNRINNYCDGKRRARIMQYLAQDQIEHKRAPRKMHFAQNYLYLGIGSF